MRRPRSHPGAWGLSQPGRSGTQPTSAHHGPLATVIAREARVRTVDRHSPRGRDGHEVVIDDVALAVEALPVAVPNGGADV